ncbi:Slowpoke-binding protein-like [Homarus americanus]|uniref:Slowpoke-binding protein-like n=1 Tax=Homarus americanus TaxID=6706 RepID=A0A8J5K4L0_HOMAM|nr:Slowpoke-binding protein-like [Homarus americanus]
MGHGGRYHTRPWRTRVPGALEMERKVARGASRTPPPWPPVATSGDTSGTPSRAPSDIGSRIDKNWFMIRDSSVKTDRLMTLQPFDEQCPFPVTQGTREALVELFQALHHPYIYPVLDVDFANISSHTYVITVIPHNAKGTLKDLIYRSHWQDDWSEKYQQRSAGLPVSQVQRLGRQVLEALLFLQDRGFPPCDYPGWRTRCWASPPGSTPSSSGVSEITGMPSIPYASMCAGYELSSAHPTAKHLEDISTYPQVVQVLEYIFGNGDQYPSVEEILCLDFFRNLDLREMRAAPLPSQFQIRYSPMIRNILKEVRRFQKQRRRGRRGGGTASGGEGGGDTPTSSEASASGAGGGDDSMPPTSAYNTPTASLAALSSPTSDVTPSPEHPTHRLLEVSSPQRQHPSICQDVFHTPPHTPPTPQNHPIRANHISQAHNDRPLTTTRYPPRDSRSTHWSNTNHLTQNGHAGHPLGTGETSPLHRILTHQWLKAESENSDITS